MSIRLQGFIPLFAKMKSIGMSLFSKKRSAGISFFSQGKNFWTKMKKILVALDLPDADRALELVKLLSPHVGGFKIGQELFTIGGPDLVRQITRLGVLVFLDLKLYDIPNTVARTVAAATKLGVHMISVHASGGREMMRAAIKAANDTANDTAVATGEFPPLILAVTVLTSMDYGTLYSTGITDQLDSQVERLAKLAMDVGIRGLVCSPHEITKLRDLNSMIQLVVPGIRSPNDPPDDQKRTLTCQQAISLGASWVVIGRPITCAQDPVQIIKKLTN
jgi:orotidine-5'-phosphate decarboxylase